MLTVFLKARQSTGGKSCQGFWNHRYRVRRRANILGITTPAFRRLARCGGVKRISRPIYDDMRGVLKIFLEGVIRNAALYTEHGHRTTVTQLDVIYALKRSGTTLYGFGS
ncbi:histone H4 [Mycena galopus ATCC 62051]|nr:histone H4 [Mycena galopus ATCC 62051]